MSKYLLPFLLIFLSTCSLNSEPVEIFPRGDTIIIIEALYGFEISYDPGESYTAKDIYTSGSTVINGSYFGIAPWPDGRWRGAGMSIPAGLWITRGQEMHPIRTDDPNLSHGVFSSGSQIQIIPNSQTDSWITSCLRVIDCKGFQAGPLVLSGNTIQDFGKSWHANESHERTLIGVTQSGKVYFFISRKQLSLTEIGEQIRLDPRFWKDPITVLNLDGGPSTVYYDGIHGFREDKNLPIFIRTNP